MGFKPGNTAAGQVNADTARASSAVNRMRFSTCACATNSFWFLNSEGSRNIVRQSVEIGSDPDFTRHRTGLPGLTGTMEGNQPGNRLASLGDDDFVSLLHRFDERRKLSFGFGNVAHHHTLILVVNQIWSGPVLECRAGPFSSGPGTVSRWRTSCRTSGRASASVAVLPLSPCGLRPSFVRYGG